MVFRKSIVASLIAISAVAYSSASQVYMSPKDTNEIYCLANNIYFESRNQSVAGRVAVGYVTINRVASERFPNTICGVVTQKYKRKCQFTWYCGKRKSINDHGAYGAALSIAWKLFYANRLMWDETDGALWYHADYIKAPIWTKDMVVSNKIGNHIFYVDRKIEE